MKINVEKILKKQANEFISDANFAYDNDTNDLNNETGHMVAQKTLWKVNVINTFFKNVINENDIQKSTSKLIKKMFKQMDEDIDYMYPDGNLEEENIHVVMQLIKRTGEDIENVLECFEQSSVIECKVNIQEILKEQFKEYDSDIDYAYPETNYEDDNAHIVIQGLLGKSEFLINVLESVTPANKDEKEFKENYLEKLNGLIELLNSGYNKKGYYKNNGHDIFTELLEGLQVELKDLSEMTVRNNEEINNFSNDKKFISKESSIENNINKVEISERELEEDKQIRSEEVKQKFKKMM